MKRTADEIRQHAQNIASCEARDERDRPVQGLAVVFLEAIADICERLDAMLARMPVPEVAPVEWFTCARHLGVEDGREVVCGKAAGHDGFPESCER